MGMTSTAPHLPYSLRRMQTGLDVPQENLTTKWRLFERSEDPAAAEVVQSSPSRIESHSLGPLREM